MIKPYYIRTISLSLGLLLLLATWAGADITTGLTLWWKLDDASGTSAVDSSGASRTGTLVNTPSWDTAPNCHAGGCLVLNGTTQTVTQAADMGTLMTVSAGTMAVWIKPTASATSAAEPYNLPGILADSSGYQTIAYGISTGHGSLDRIWVLNYSGGAVQTIGAVYALSVWTHIAWVHTGGTLFMYKDGALVSSLASGNTDENAGTLIVGSNYQSFAFFGGSVDEVRFYNIGLAATDVQELYALGQSKRRPLFLD